MSLKANLQQLIKERYPETLTLNELEAYCHKARYKLSNAERRLRASESPNIRAIRNPKGAIIAYQWLKTAPGQEKTELTYLGSSRPYLEPVKSNN